MSENEVSLLISGDASDLDKAIADATKHVQGMGEAVSTAGGHAADAAPHFGEIGEKAGGLAGKAGQAYGATGALGSGLALAGIQGGPLVSVLNGIGLGFDALSGIGDSVELLSGFGKAAKGTAIATDEETVSQEGLNLAFFTSPIFLIGAAIAALVVIIVLIATKTDWFQKIWRAAWGGVKSAAEAVGHWFTDTLWPGIKNVYDKISNGISAVVGFFEKIPGRIGKAFGGLASAITAPFRTAFNFIADAWNNTIGRLSFSIPSWVPGIGGKGFNVPDIPHFDTGGVVPGAPGAPLLAVVHGGETVTPAGRSGQTITVSAGDAVTAGVFAAIRQEVATRFGGDVTIALAGSR